jgi:hypothetical protein
LVALLHSLVDLVVPLDTPLRAVSCERP